jgi:ATP-dependent protease ClpP protease subunit
VFGIFDDALISRIIPSIIRYRKASDHAITVYIHSPGGSIRSLEVLLGALNDLELDGNECRIITVAYGDSKSAAATLLSLGDYVLAYPRSEMHYHGVRYNEIETLTIENAAGFVADLSKRNRRIALQLAKATIRRLAHRYSLVSGEFDEIKKIAESESMSALECFVAAVSGRVAGRAKHILSTALNRSRDAFHLSSLMIKNDQLKPTSADKSVLHSDADVFKAVIDYEINRTDIPAWKLDEAGCNRVVSDYLVIRDYYIGEHVDSFGWIAKQLGYVFMSDMELERLEQLEKESQEKAEQWSFEIVFPILQPFWYFTVCLCRLLQEGENRLSASECYWMGLVDEVIDTDLIGYRAIMEASPNPDAISGPASGI